ncbi:MAG: hypothetical protein K9G47_07405 [Bacteroidales bacterium]|nr:hypothetical protein [Bacteroidales bacterium]
MMNARKLYAMLLIVVSAILLMPFSGCKKDKDEEVPARETTYKLKAQDVLGVTGTATFTETSNTSSTITLKLYGAPSGTHPAALCMNTVVEGGNTVVELNPVDASGSSSTSVNALTYNQLIAYDGFIKVVESSSEPDVILAQGDIGGNVITDINVSYPLDTVGAFGVSGSALFEKRKNGNTLVTLNISGTIAGEEYPASINLGSVESIGGGPVTKTLSSVNGTTGKSFTNIRKLDSGVNITYENWLVYDGYINIYQIAAEFDNIICHGNIGSNVD